MPSHLNKCEKMRFYCSCIFNCICIITVWLYHLLHKKKNQLILLFIKQQFSNKTLVWRFVFLIKPLILIFFPCHLSSMGDKRREKLRLCSRHQIPHGECEVSLFGNDQAAIQPPFLTTMCP